VCACAERLVKTKERLNTPTKQRRDEVTKRMVSGEAITSSKEESLILKEAERLC